MISVLNYALIIAIGQQLGCTIKHHAMGGNGDGCGGDIDARLAKGLNDFYLLMIIFVYIASPDSILGCSSKVNINHAFVYENILCYSHNKTICLVMCTYWAIRAFYVPVLWIDLRDHNDFTRNSDP